MGKYFLYTALFLILSGCFQTSSFVGPVYTFGSTGNISQTSVNFGLNKIFEMKTGKNSISFVNDFFKIDNLKRTDDEVEEYVLIDEKKLINLVQINLEKTKKILSDQ